MTKTAANWKAGPTNLVVPSPKEPISPKPKQSPMLTPLPVGVGGQSAARTEGIGYRNKKNTKSD